MCFFKFPILSIEGLLVQSSIFSRRTSKLNSISIQMSSSTDAVIIQTVKPEFVLKGDYFCCPIPRDAPNIKSAEFPTIKAKYKTDICKFDKSSYAQKMMKGEYNNASFTHISIPFSSPSPMKGAYICLYGYSRRSTWTSSFSPPSHLIFTLTSSKGDKRSKKYEFPQFNRDFKFIGDGWHFLPVDLPDVVLCEITGKGTDGKYFEILSLVFITTEETTEEITFREAREKLWSETPVVKSEFVKKGDKESEGMLRRQRKRSAFGVSFDRKSIPIPRYDPKLVDPSFSMVKCENDAYSKESEGYDRSSDAQRMLKGECNFELSHLSIPFPSPSPMKGAYICVDKDWSSPSLIFTFTDRDGNSTSKKFEFFQPKNLYEWHFLPIGLWNVVLCEIEGKGMWKEKNSRCFKIYSLIFLRGDDIPTSPPLLTPVPVPSTSSKTPTSTLSLPLKPVKEVVIEGNDKDPTPKDIKQKKHKDKKKHNPKEFKPKSNPKHDSLTLTSASTLTSQCIIGSGGFGEVLLVKVDGIPFLCVLKKMLRIADKTVVKGCRKEFKVQLKLFTNPKCFNRIPRPLYILDLLDCDMKGVYGFLMEFCVGGSVSAFAKRWCADGKYVSVDDTADDSELSDSDSSSSSSKSDDLDRFDPMTLNPVKVCSLCVGMIECLDDVFTAKPKLVHRDVKPDNFLVRVDSASNLCTVVLADLGFVQIQDSISSSTCSKSFVAPSDSDPSSSSSSSQPKASSHLTQKPKLKRSICGTLVYNSYEALRHGIQSQSSDAHSLGMSILSLFLCCDPFIQMTVLRGVDDPMVVAKKLIYLMTNNMCPHLSSSPLFDSLLIIEESKYGPVHKVFDEVFTGLTLLDCKKRMSVHQARVKVQTIKHLLPLIGEDFDCPSIDDIICEQRKKYGGSVGTIEGGCDIVGVEHEEGWDQSFSLLNVVPCAFSETVASFHENISPLLVRISIYLCCFIVPLCYLLVYVLGRRCSVFLCHIAQPLTRVETIPANEQVIFSKFNRLMAVLCIFFIRIVFTTLSPCLLHPFFSLYQQNISLSDVLMCVLLCIVAVAGLTLNFLFNDVSSSSIPFLRLPFSVITPANHRIFSIVPIINILAPVFAVFSPSIGDSMAIFLSLFLASYFVKKRPCSSHHVNSSLAAFVIAWVAFSMVRILLYFIFYTDSSIPQCISHDTDSLFTKFRNEICDIYCERSSPFSSGWVFGCFYLFLFVLLFIIATCIFEHIFHGFLSNIIEHMYALGTGGSEPTCVVSKVKASELSHGYFSELLTYSKTQILRRLRKAHSGLAIPKVYSSITQDKSYKFNLFDTNSQAMFNMHGRPLISGPGIAPFVEKVSTDSECDAKSFLSDIGPPLNGGTLACVLFGIPIFVVETVLWWLLVIIYSFIYVIFQPHRIHLWRMLKKEKILQSKYEMLEFIHERIPHVEKIQPIPHLRNQISTSSHPNHLNLESLINTSASPPDILRIVDKKSKMRKRRGEEEEEEKGKESSRSSSSHSSHSSINRHIHSEEYSSSSSSLSVFEVPEISGNIQVIQLDDEDKAGIKKEDVKVIIEKEKEEEEEEERKSQEMKQERKESKKKKKKRKRNKGAENDIFEDLESTSIDELRSKYSHLEKEVKKLEESLMKPNPFPSPGDLFLSSPFLSFGHSLRLELRKSEYEKHEQLELEESILAQKAEEEALIERSLFTSANIGHVQQHMIDERDALDAIENKMQAMIDKWILEFNITFGENAQVSHEVRCYSPIYKFLFFGLKLHQCMFFPSISCLIIRLGTYILLRRVKKLKYESLVTPVRKFCVDFDIFRENGHSYLSFFKFQSRTWLTLSKRKNVLKRIIETHCRKFLPFFTSKPPSIISHIDDDIIWKKYEEKYYSNSLQNMPDMKYLFSSNLFSPEMYFLLLDISVSARLKNNRIYDNAKEKLGEEKTWMTPQRNFTSRTNPYNLPHDLDHNYDEPCIIGVDMFQMPESLETVFSYFKRYIMEPLTIRAFSQSDKYRILQETTLRMRNGGPGNRDGNFSFTTGFPGLSLQNGDISYGDGSDFGFIFGEVINRTNESILGMSDESFRRLQYLSKEDRQQPKTLQVHPISQPWYKVFHRRITSHISSILSTLWCKHSFSFGDRGGTGRRKILHLFSKAPITFPIFSYVYELCVAAHPYSVIPHIVFARWSGLAIGDVDSGLSVVGTIRRRQYRQVNSVEDANSMLPLLSLRRNTELCSFSRYSKNIACSRNKSKSNLKPNMKFSRLQINSFAQDKLEGESPKSVLFEEKWDRYILSFSECVSGPHEYLSPTKCEDALLMRIEATCTAVASNLLRHNSKMLFSIKKALSKLIMENSSLQGPMFPSITSPFTGVGKQAIANPEQKHANPGNGKDNKKSENPSSKKKSTIKVSISVSVDELNYIALLLCAEKIGRWTLLPVLEQRVFLMYSIFRHLSFLPGCLAYQAHEVSSYASTAYTLIRREYLTHNIGIMARNSDVKRYAYGDVSNQLSQFISRKFLKHPGGSGSNPHPASSNPVHSSSSSSVSQSNSKFRQNPGPHARSLSPSPSPALGVDGVSNGNLRMKHHAYERSGARVAEHSKVLYSSAYPHAFKTITFPFDEENIIIHRLALYDKICSIYRYVCGEDHVWCSLLLCMRDHLFVCEETVRVLIDKTALNVSKSLEKAAIRYLNGTMPSPSKYKHLTNMKSILTAQRRIASKKYNHLYIVKEKQPPKHQEKKVGSAATVAVPSGSKSTAPTVVPSVPPGVPKIDTANNSISVPTAPEKQSVVKPDESVPTTKDQRILTLQDMTFLQQISIDNSTVNGQTFLIDVDEDSTIQRDKERRRQEKLLRNSKSLRFEKPIGYTNEVVSLPCALDGENSVRILLLSSPLQSQEYVHTFAFFQLLRQSSFDTNNQNPISHSIFEFPPVPRYPDKLSRFHVRKRPPTRFARDLNCDLWEIEKKREVSAESTSWVGKKKKDIKERLMAECNLDNIKLVKEVIPYKSDWRKQVQALIMKSMQSRRESCILGFARVVWALLSLLGVLVILISIISIVTNIRYQVSVSNLQQIMAERNHIFADLIYASSVYKTTYEGMSPFQSNSRAILFGKQIRSLSYALLELEYRVEEAMASVYDGSLTASEMHLQLRRIYGGGLESFNLNMDIGALVFSRKRSLLDYRESFGRYAQYRLKRKDLFSNEKDIDDLVDKSYPYCGTEEEDIIDLSNTFVSNPLNYMNLAYSDAEFGHFINSLLLSKESQNLKKSHFIQQEKDKLGISNISTSVSKTFIDPFVNLTPPQAIKIFANLMIHLSKHENRELFASILDSLSVFENLMAPSESAEAVISYLLDDNNFSHVHQPSMTYPITSSDSKATSSPSSVGIEFARVFIFTGMNLPVYISQESMIVTSILNKLDGFSLTGTLSLVILVLLFITLIISMVVLTVASLHMNYFSTNLAVNSKVFISNQQCADKLLLSDKIFVYSLGAMRHLTPQEIGCTAPFYPEINTSMNTFSEPRVQPSIGSLSFNESVSFIHASGVCNYACSLYSTAGKAPIFEDPEHTTLTVGGSRRHSSHTGNHSAAAHTGNHERGHHVVLSSTTTTVERGEGRGEKTGGSGKPKEVAPTSTKQSDKESIISDKKHGQLHEKTEKVVQLITERIQRNQMARMQNAFVSSPFESTEDSLSDMDMLGGCDVLDKRFNPSDTHVIETATNNLLAQICEYSQPPTSNLCDLQLKKRNPKRSKFSLFDECKCVKDKMRDREHIRIVSRGPKSSYTAHRKIVRSIDWMDKGSLSPSWIIGVLFALGGCITIAYYQNGQHSLLKAHGEFSLSHPQALKAIISKITENMSIVQFGLNYVASGDVESAVAYKKMLNTLMLSESIQQFMRMAREESDGTSLFSSLYEYFESVMNIISVIQPMMGRRRQYDLMSGNIERMEETVFLEHLDYSFIEYVQFDGFYSDDLRDNYENMVNWCENGFGIHPEYIERMFIGEKRKIRDDIVLICPVVDYYRPLWRTEQDIRNFFSCDLFLDAVTQVETSKSSLINAVVNTSAFVRSDSSWLGTFNNQQGLPWTAESTSNINSRNLSITTQKNVILLMLVLGTILHCIVVIVKQVRKCMKLDKKIMTQYDYLDGSDNFFKILSWKQSIVISLTSSIFYTLLVIALFVLLMFESILLHFQNSGINDINSEHLTTLMYTEKYLNDFLVTQIPYYSRAQLKHDVTNIENAASLMELYYSNNPELYQQMKTYKSINNDKEYVLENLLMQLAVASDSDVVKAYIDNQRYNAGDSVSMDADYLSSFNAVHPGVKSITAGLSSLISPPPGVLSLRTLIKLHGQQMIYRALALRILSASIGEDFNEFCEARLNSIPIFSVGHQWRNADEGRKLHRSGGMYRTKESEQEMAWYSLAEEFYLHVYQDQGDNLHISKNIGDISSNQWNSLLHHYEIKYSQCLAEKQLNEDVFCSPPSKQTHDLILPLTLTGDAHWAFQRILVSVKTFFDSSVISMRNLTEKVFNDPTFVNVRNCAYLFCLLLFLTAPIIIVIYLRHFLICSAFYVSVQDFDGSNRVLPAISEKYKKSKKLAKKISGSSSAVIPSSYSSREGSSLSLPKHQRDKDNIVDCGCFSDSSKISQLSSEHGSTNGISSSDYPMETLNVHVSNSTPSSCQVFVRERCCIFLMFAITSVLLILVIICGANFQDGFHYTSNSMIFFSLEDIFSSSAMALSLFQRGDDLMTRHMAKHMLQHTFRAEICAVLASIGKKGINIGYGSILPYIQTIVDAKEVEEASNADDGTLPLFNNTSRHVYNHFSISDELREEILDPESISTFHEIFIPYIVSLSSMAFADIHADSQRIDNMSSMLHQLSADVQPGDDDPRYSCHLVSPISQFLAKSLRFISIDTSYVDNLQFQETTSLTINQCGASKNSINTGGNEIHVKNWMWGRDSREQEYDGFSSDFLLLDNEVAPTFYATILSGASDTLIDFNTKSSPMAIEVQEDPALALRLEMLRRVRGYDDISLLDSKVESQLGVGQESDYACMCEYLASESHSSSSTTCFLSRPHPDTFILTQPLSSLRVHVFDGLKRLGKEEGRSMIPFQNKTMVSVHESYIHYHDALYKKLVTVKDSIPFHWKWIRNGIVYTLFLISAVISFFLIYLLIKKVSVFCSLKDVQMFIYARRNH
ncbi:hypothetical protein ADUPG1_010388 [Aduncisulcus paluster]|uniref:Protein kinase domain-containing protein n=1 Tax=Aduncisulcus paluster TaxID=2918883 RepID=A0ABQ5JRQ1_9EUKA|nr:hypothetical protein ADUPG1_010388 [Aduncisulcus paluster]